MKEAHVSSVEARRQARCRIVLVASERAQVAEHPALELAVVRQVFEHHERQTRGNREVGDRSSNRAREDIWFDAQLESGRADERELVHFRHADHALAVAVRTKQVARP